jgi:hypothetical protein
MGSVKNYLDLSQQERDNLQAVLDDAAVSVDVYRRPPQVGAAGLTTDTAEPVFLRTISARVDAYRSRSLGENDSNPVNTKPIGLKEDTDVRPHDLWRYTDVTDTVRWYRVASVARGRSGSSTVLQETKR